MLADRRVRHRHAFSGTLQSVPGTHTLIENPGLAGGLGQNRPVGGAEKGTICEAVWLDRANDWVRRCARHSNATICYAPRRFFIQNPSRATAAGFSHAFLEWFSRRGHRRPAEMQLFQVDWLFKACVKSANTSSSLFETRSPEAKQATSRFGNSTSPVQSHPPHCRKACLIKFSCESACIFPPRFKQRGPGAFVEPTIEQSVAC